MRKWYFLIIVSQICSLSAANLWLHKMSVHRSSFSYFVQNILLGNMYLRPDCCRGGCDVYVDANASKKPLRISRWLRQVLLKCYYLSTISHNITHIFSLIFRTRSHPITQIFILIFRTKYFSWKYVPASWLLSWGLWRVRGCKYFEETTSNLKVAAASSSEMLLSIYNITQCAGPEDQHVCSSPWKIILKIHALYIGCPTRYRTRHFFNNSNTN
jgi:hypothetical protein